MHKNHERVLQLRMEFYPQITQIEVLGLGCNLVARFLSTESTEGTELGDVAVALQSKHFIAHLAPRSVGCM